MNKIKIVCFIITCGFVYTAIAQDDAIASMPMKTWQNVKDSLSLLSEQVLQLKSDVRAKEDSIATLNKRLVSANSMNNGHNNTIKSLQEENKKLKSDLEMASGQLRTMQSQFGRVDTMTIKIIITYMSLKCSEERIGKLRKDFANISNDKIRRDYKRWDDVLAVYSLTYNGIRDVIVEASGKIPTAMMPPLQERYKNEANNKINALEYVKSFYNAKDYTSPYLNEMIKKAIHLVQNSKNKSDYESFLESYP